MYKSKQLYVDVSDDDGHTYLIKLEDVEDFEKELSVLENKLSFDLTYDEDDYCNDFENLVEHFNAKSLEGGKVYIVLPEDIIEGEED